MLLACFDVLVFSLDPNAVPADSSFVSDDTLRNWAKVSQNAVSGYERHAFPVDSSDAFRYPGKPPSERQAGCRGPS